MRRRFSRSERGQSLVEFAMVLPLFLVLIFAIVDFGIGFQQHITLTNAAREGARYGITGKTSKEITNRVKDTAAGMDPTVNVVGAQGPSGTELEVTATKTIKLITPLASMISYISGGGFTSQFTLNSTAKMRIY